MHQTSSPVRAAIYLRISLDRTGEGAGVDRQREACKAFLSYKGWDLEAEYVDNSVSATRGKPRPEYERLIADVRAGRLDAVVVWKLDRLTRRPIEIEDWITLHEEHGVVLTTTDGDLDLSTASGQTIAGILANIARGEMKMKGDRQRAAHKQRASAGKPWATRRPFGFEADGITHNPSEAEMLKGAYGRLIAGASQSEIARWLSERSTTTVGNPWQQTTVRNLLLNPRNAGLTAHNGVIVGPAVWQPIVDETQWTVALRLLTKGVHPGGGARKHLLVGVLVCGVCEAPARTGYTSRGVRLYKCETGRHVGRKAEDVEEFVSAMAIARFARADVVATTLRAPVDTAGLADEAATLRSRLDGFGINVADGDLTPKQARAATERVMEKLEVIERKLAETESAHALAPLLAAADVEEVWASMDVSVRRSAISALGPIALMPTGRGNRFNPDAIDFRWDLKAISDSSVDQIQPH
jgi:site-specific DNA recombinase